MPELERERPAGPLPSWGYPTLAAALSAAGLAWYAASAGIVSDEYTFALAAVRYGRTGVPLEYFPGQHYMGGTPLLAPAWTTRLFETPWLGLRLHAVILLALACAAGVEFIRRVAGGRAAAAGICLLATPPVFYLANVVRLRGYTDPVLLGLLLLLIIELRREREARPGGGSGFLWGLLAGAAFYANPQSVFLTVPAGLMLLAQRPVAAAFAWAAPGLLLGVAPMLAHWHETGIFLKTLSPQFGELREALSALPRRLATLAGAEEDPRLAVRCLTGAVGTAWLGAGLLAWAARARREAESRRLAPLLLAPIGGLALFLLSGRWGAERYFIVAYPATAILAAAGWGALLSRRPALLLALLLGAAVELYALQCNLDSRRRVPDCVAPADARAAAELLAAGADGVVGSSRLVIAVSYFSRDQLPFLAWYSRTETVATMPGYREAVYRGRNLALAILDADPASRPSGPPAREFAEWMARLHPELPRHECGTAWLYPGVGSWECAEALLTEFDAFHAAGKTEALEATEGAP